VKVTKQHTFDAPVEDVWAMFRDRDSHVAKFEGMGHRNLEVLEHEADEDRVRIVIARDVTLDLPGFARKVLKPTNHVVSTDEWRANGDGTYGGAFDMDTKGAPVDISGTTHIAPEGDGRTRYELETHVSVNVPVVGKRITNWAKGDVEKQMQQEFDAGDAWLADNA
jgi:hypothetical protein